MNHNTQSKERGTIIRRIAEGDRSAVEECVKTYGNLVWWLAKRYTTSREDAEDAVQEIFLEIWQNAGRYDAAKSAESTFISMLAYRRLVDRLRKIYAQGKVQSIEDLYETANGRDNDFERQLHAGIEAERAYAAVRRLRSQQRDLILMTVFEGMSHGEIADRTGLPLGTVKTHIRRGLRSVRQIMNPEALAGGKSTSRARGFLAV